MRSPTGTAWRSSPGKMVSELPPAVPSDKGEAVGKVVASCGVRSVLVAGDDLTARAGSP